MRAEERAVTLILAFIEYLLSCRKEKKNILFKNCDWFIVIFSYVMIMGFKMIIFTVIACLLLSNHLIEALPNGAPPESCATMVPNHGFPAQQSASPYMTMISQDVNKSSIFFMLIISFLLLLFRITFWSLEIDYH